MQTLRYVGSLAARNVQTVGPWFSLLGLSATLAFVLNGAVAGWTPPTLAAPPPAMQWITLSSIDRSVTCLTSPDRFAADALELHPADVDRIAADLRCETQDP
jgi:hypothetical protein